MNQRRRVGWLKHFDFMFIDLLCIQFSLLIGIYLRHHSFKVYQYHNGDPYITFNILLLAVNLCYVLLFNAYNNILKRGKTAELKNIIVQNLVLWGISMGILYMNKDIEIISRTIFTISIVFSLSLMFVTRLLWKHVIIKLNRKSKNLPRTLLVTTSDKAQNLLDEIMRHKYLDFSIEGIALFDDSDLKAVNGIPVVCGKEDFYSFAKNGVIDDVMVFLPTEYKGADIIIGTLLEMGIVVHIGLDHWGNDLPNSYCERFGGFNFLTTSVSTAGVLRLLIKRIIDICAGLVGCVITGIAWLFVAPLIYKASPGPIFYSQTRVGRSGRHFKIYKFRSMYMDADERKKELMAQNEMQGNMFKMENDPRIIGSEKGPGKGIGNFIRRFSIDELPQFYNILIGDMSLVGTRPPTVDEVEKYDLHHMVRLSMKPGLTGMWQVSGRSSITDFEEVVRLDASYIKNWSLKLDIKIILKTFVAVFKKDGAE